MRLLSSFGRNRRGNVATIFALAMIPVMGAAGVAIDYARAAKVRGKLADALDAGVLAVGSRPAMTNAQAFAMVNDWVSIHMGADYARYWHLDSISQDQASGKIVAVATGAVDTTIARVLGVTSIPLSVESEAVRSIGKIELALVLDNTGSMAGTKLASLKTAANALVDTLSSAAANPADLKIALVPFSQTVNVGPTYKSAAWLDTGAISPINDEIFTKASGTSHANRLTLFNQMGVAWGGCVESRQMPYDIEETAPTASIPATLFTPYFAPDEPDSKTESGGKNGNFGTFYNDYLTDGTYSTSTFRVPQGAVAKYTASPKTGSTGMGYKLGPNSGCELAPLLRLSTNTSAVKNAINAMTAVGDTNIPMGLAWGWHVLSPLAPFADGVPYGTSDWTKIVVLMTDGQNQNTDSGNDNDSFYSGLGYVWQNRVGVGAGSTSAQRQVALDGRLSALCAAMKQKDIVLYTVRVEVTTGTSTVLSNCASGNDKFSDVQNAANLTAAFQNIGGSIQKLRLAR